MVLQVQYLVFFNGRHRKGTFPTSLNASPDNGRVSAYQHVGVGVSIRTLQSVFRLTKCRRSREHLEENGV